MKALPHLCQRLCRALMSGLGALVASTAPGTSDAASDAAPPAPCVVQYSVVHTASRSVTEALLRQGGRVTVSVPLTYSALLVRHGGETLLFDTGLGRLVDDQVAKDMPRWMRPLFGPTGPVSPVRDQLEAAGLPMPKRIVLSHAHWDHASGVPDFPDATVWVDAGELAWRDEVRREGRPLGLGSPWPSQVGGDRPAWRALPLQARPVEGLARSLDLSGDGRVQIVSLAGHTPGSIGLLLAPASGPRLLFIGDASWRNDDTGTPHRKFAAASWLVDHDRAATAQAIEQLAAWRAREPTLVIVPAHDAEAQAVWPRFPAWGPTGCTGR